MLYKHESNPRENNNAPARSQQSYFATLLKSYPRTDKPPKTRSTSAEHHPQGEDLCGTASACQENFERLKLRKFTAVNRN